MSLNNLIIPFSNLLDQKGQNSLKEFTHSLNFQANPSFVFHRKTQENVIDPEVRKSKTCFSKDPDLLQFINDTLLVQMNNAVNSKYTFKLARDYVTFIRYDKGDFFDWHTDFEKLRVNHGDNGFKEMHFLYCIQAPVSGGQLLIKKGVEVTEPALSSDIIAVQEACTENSAVVFDKLMQHSGAEVKEGTKIIMTVDLYVLSEARVKAGLTQESENELSDFLAKTKKKEWISLKGDTDAFKKVWATLDKDKDTIIPFLELKASVRGDSYRVFATAAGINYVEISRENSKTDGFEFREDQWYYTDEGGNKCRFTLLYNKDRLKKNPWSYNRYEYGGRGQTEAERIQEEKEVLRNDIASAFYKNQNNPGQFLFAAIEHLSMSEEDGGIRGWPKIPFLVDKSVPTLKNLPTYFFSNDDFLDWGFAKTEVGYTYHCNEPSYDEFDVNYRYGLMRVPTAVLADESENYDWEEGDINAPEDPTSDETGSEDVEQEQGDENEVEE